MVCKLGIEASEESPWFCWWKNYIRYTGKKNIYQIFTGNCYETRDRALHCSRLILVGPMLRWQDERD